MPSPGKTPAILLGVLLLGLAGCSDKVAEAPEGAGTPPQQDGAEKADAPKPAASTNNVAKAEFFPGATPEEFAHMKACFEAIDDGHDAFAVRHAREFMDSTNAEVRLQAVEAFGWVGKFAVKELAEMMADANEDVSSEALRQWEMAFDEYSSETSRMRELERAATLLKDQDKLDTVMMKVSGLEDYNAVKVLSDIISSTNSSPIAAEVARAEYASLTGEPFVGEKRADQLVTILRNHAEGTEPRPSQVQPSKDLTKKGTR